MEELATLEKKDGSETFTVPESRIGTAANARALIGKLVQAEETRAGRRSKQQGLLDGNPPYNPQKLKEKGQGHRTNLNLREAEGALDAAKTPYYGLVFDPPQVAQFDFRYGDNAIQNAEWSRIIAEEFHSMVTAWDGFDFNIQLHQWEMCYYGVGPIYWQDARDWRFDALKIGELLVPEGSAANLDKLELCLIRPRRGWLAHELWRFIKNEAAAKAAKWNVAEVKKAIAEATTNPGSTISTQDFEEVQRQLRNGDLSVGHAKSKSVQPLHLLVKEFSGKISHYILAETPTSTASATVNAFLTRENELEGFLYAKKERFESFANVICPFFFDIGTGDWHSIKGLGPKIFDFCEVSNRLTCDMIDGARMGSGITLQANDANSLQQTSIVHIGGGTVIQPGFEVKQTKIAENLQGPLAVKRDVQNTLQSNTGQYRQRVSDENQEPTLGQAQMNATAQATLGQGSVNRYCKIGDRMYREMARRALHPSLAKSDPGGEEALEFRERCIERGVPEDGLKWENVRCVKMTRGIGNGSTQLRQIVAQWVITMLPTMQEPARNSALRLAASSIPGGGQQLADLLYPPLSIADVPDDQDWAAAIENGLLREMSDAMPIVTGKQDHVAHFASHFQDVALHAQQLQNGQSNPMELMVHLEKTGPHTKEHLDKIADDPTRKGQVETLTKMWLGLSKMADQLHQQIEEAQTAVAAQQPEQTPDPKLIAALAKVNGELGIKREAQAGKLQLQREKQEASIRLKDLLAAANIRRESGKDAAREAIAA